MINKLAVIIPTYDNLNMLKRLIGQVYNFTPKGFKLFIIEDGQREDAIIHLKSLRDERDNITNIFHQRNMGVAVSWNDGIKKAEKSGCDIFAIFNDDIEIYPDWWQEVEGKIEQGYDLVSTNQPEPPQIDHKGTRGFAGHFFILTKRCINKIGYFDEQFTPFCGEDTDYSYRFNKSNLKMILLENPKLKHHKGTTTEQLIAKIDPNYYWGIRQGIHQKLARKYPDYAYL